MKKEYQIISFKDIYIHTHIHIYVYVCVYLYLYINIKRLRKTWTKLLQ